MQEGLRQQNLSISITGVFHCKNYFKIMLIKFQPLLKQTIWGGNKIIPFKHLDTKLDQVGESWEISGVKDNETIISDGIYAGTKLNDLVAKLKGELVGEENYKRFGNVFPLLIKFLDAQKQLSIQVHPNDETAHKLGYPMGKTEMWYIMPSDSNAKLRSGLKKKITPEQYKEMVADGTITDAIAEYPVKEGDCFFLPSGRIHSIGAGCFLAEIQHIKEAAESIDYTVSDDYRTHYEHKENEPMTLVQCPFFTTTLYDLTEPMTLDYSDLDSFVILIGVGGEGTITDSEGNTTTLNAGETILVPATESVLNVKGTLKFLESYV